MRSLAQTQSRLFEQMLAEAQCQDSQLQDLVSRQMVMHLQTQVSYAKWAYWTKVSQPVVFQMDGTSSQRTELSFQ